MQACTALLAPYGLCWFAEKDFEAFRSTCKGEELEACRAGAYLLATVKSHSGPCPHFVAAAAA